MTTRQDLRNAYPFHNPRRNVVCCHRCRVPKRQTWLQRTLSRLFG